MGDEGNKLKQEDNSFLRTEDTICLNCVTTQTKDGSSGNGERVCLAAEGFGNRMCFLQSMSNKELPFDISVCVFVLEQALSVRALQEMVSAKSSDTAGQSGGHRTLLYGHAVQLRHAHSNMYLSCLSTQSSSTDKLAFDVGLIEQPEGESCWWTIHPASKQRSEGEKVRVGDDLILVSVASERYLHIGAAAMVIASFQQTLWTVQPVSSGAIRQKSLGFVFGGEVLRLFHGDECLTIPPRDAENSQSSVMYETGAVASHARSLWKLEHVRTKWAEGFMCWGQACRLRHVTSGRYLGVQGENQVVTLHRSVATEETSAFLLRQSKDDRKFQESHEDEGMGTADIKYGDSLVYVQHMKSGLWLSYQTFETKKRGVGRVEEKKAVLMVEGHMDDGLTMSRAQEEEDKSARVIRKCTSLISRFVKALESLKTEGRTSHLWEGISLSEVIKMLEDLIDYFAPPSKDLVTVTSEEHADTEFEERQIRLKALRNRQDLFQEEGMIALILETIDKCSQWKSMRHLAHLIGEDSAAKWNDMINYLYLLLAAMMQGNHANCSRFASSKRLDWLVNKLENQDSSTAALIQGNHSNCTQFASSQRIDWLVKRLLESQQSSQGVLDVLHCVLIDSPEALNVIKEQHIRTIISLIDKHGRDPKVLNVLCSLCVGNGVAVRSNQKLICENLLPGRDLLLQTKVVDHIYSMHPNIYVGRCEGSSMYKHWYYEVILDHIETVSSLPPVIRIGWANTEGYVPYPGGGSHWGCNGAGDDLYSYAFDGVNLWTAGKPKRVRADQQRFQKGDIIGISLDLGMPQISFTVNGIRVKGFFRDFNLDGMFFPIVSMSAKASIRFMMGGEHGKLKYGLPPGHSPICESLLPKERLKITPSFQFGDVPRGLVHGPDEVRDLTAFVPQPVDTAAVVLPAYIESINHKLAENIHESWAMAKIENGWTYGERRDDSSRQHPFLTGYDKLPPSEKSYNQSVAYETLKTLLAMGYHISYDANYTSNNRMRTMKLPNHFLQSNGYKPTPLDISNIHLNDRMNDLVDLLAENTHNVWSRERIKGGWTYGNVENVQHRRSPHLVPYCKVDESIKKANRTTASETVKTLMSYGYTLDPPANEGQETVSKDTADKKAPMRLYRAEKTYSIDSGKWYYELEVITTGNMRVGFALISLDPGTELGLTSSAYVFDGMLGRKWHQGSESYGKIWQKGDIIGCMIDIGDKTISFSLNGELMMDRLGQEIAFKGIDVSEPLIPAFCMGAGQQAKINFGQDVHSLKFFTTCGLQEGYEPYCVNMTRQMSLWYGKEKAGFGSLEKEHPRIEVVKVPGGSMSAPCIKVNSKTYGTLERVYLEFLRLSLPVKFQDQFVPAREKQITIEKRMNFDRLKKTKDSEDDLLIHVNDYGDFMRPFPMKSHEKRSIFKKKPQKLARSMDDSSVETLDKHVGTNLRRHESETNILLVPNKDKSNSKLSFIDKFADVSKAINDKNSNKRGKSPFSLFKKAKSRDPSPIGINAITSGPGSDHSSTLPASLPAKVQMSSSEYSEDEDSDSLALGPTINISHAPGGTGTGHHHHGMKTSSSMASYGSELESEPEGQDLEANLDIIDEYYYGVRIFPGQDPSQIYIGWVTPQYHNHCTQFEMKKVRNVVVCSLDVDYQIKSSVSRKNCYIVSAGDLQNRYSHQEDAGKRMTPGILIGCHCDTSTGILSFTVNGQEVANKFQVEPGAMLFPAVFFEPTNKEVLQFELGRTKTSLPLSAALFRGGKHVQPQCPPRLDLQVLKPHTWSRVPMMSHKVHTLKLSDIRGWSMLCEDPVHMMALYIPEEDRCLDVMELIEHKDLLEFHTHTLQLYQAVCSHGNHRVGHELTKHVDEMQMMFTIKSQYMPGPLRMGFHNLMISIHLESHAKTRMMTQHEYIIPLHYMIKELRLFRPNYMDSVQQKIKGTIPSLEKTVSIRPKPVDDERPTSAENSMSSPYFPFILLKKLMMDLVTKAVQKGAGHIRDPIGGSNENLFAPLVRVIDKLLVMGLLDDSDLDHLLCLIDPTCFDPTYNPDEEPLIETEGQLIVSHEVTNKKYGLLQIKLSEPVKLEVCTLLHHLCDMQLRHRVECIAAFSDAFVNIVQSDQLARYTEIKLTDMPMAIAAKKTREFRCPPQEQMRSVLAFHKEDLESEEVRLGLKMECPVGPQLRTQFLNFHHELLQHCNHPEPEPEEGSEGEGNTEQKQLSWSERLLAMVASKEEKTNQGHVDTTPDNLQKLITQTIIRWAKSDFISNQELIREMFSLLHRQYDGLGELRQALDKGYVISGQSAEDIKKLQANLGIVRSLLSVQVGQDEENLLKDSIWNLADNRVFFQHPDLMRSLSIHETVMQLMVNTLNKAQQQSAAVSTDTTNAQRRASIVSNGAIEIVAEPSNKDTTADMVVACCRFLCYFCRTGRNNQRAMFEHLSYLLDNSCMLLYRPSLRGSCPLDVAYSSLMDNNELALALRESDLDKVAVYLSRCGQQSNQELLMKGYPDIGWDPVEGERFLDFFRFCVWVNGESVEENANLVVRLLIRRPECLGPALRGEGGGLHNAMEDGIMMSLQVVAARDPDTMRCLYLVTEEEDDDRINYLTNSNFDLNNLPPEDDEDYIDLGAARLAFYSSLVNLLGHCAPDAETIKAGRSDSIRARAILRSLVSMEDLEGVLSLRFILPVGKPETVMKDDGEMETIMSATLPPGLLPMHKDAIVQFMERVYGIENQQTFFRLIEEGFLPDMRAVTMLDEYAVGESDMALALNRYLCISVLPMLTKNCFLFNDADHASQLLDQILHTTYQLSKCKSLTKNQRENVSDFLVAFTSELRPPMMTSLLRKLVVDVPALTENTIVSLRVLTNHYERCGRYYGSGGWGSHGSATEEERRLTMMLFSGIFDSLAQRAYDPELFSKALPCLSAIGCALSPDYSLSNQDESLYKQYVKEADTKYRPQPADTSKNRLTEQLNRVCIDFSEHYHDSWSMNKIETGWTFGTHYDENSKKHPMLRTFQLLSDRDKIRYIAPVEESLKAMLSWGWSIDMDTTRAVSKSQIKRKMSKLSLGDFAPRPADLRNVTLTRSMLEMAEKISENSHESWAFKKMRELQAIGGGIHSRLVPYSVLTDTEKKKQREKAQELVRFLQTSGYRIIGGHTGHSAVRHRDTVGGSSMEKRFAYSLLEKLLEYVDKAALNMKNTKPATKFSKRHSFSIATEDVKFFGKVVLPLVVKYFQAHKDYFITNPNLPQASGSASNKEKEMTASLFSKLALLLRQRITAFGHDVQISVRCLQTLVQAIDARAIKKSSPEIIRSSMLPFFTFAADDLTQTVHNLKIGRFSHVKGTITRGATSLNYVHMVLLPVLTSLFDHLGRNSFGSDLLVDDEQLCCYRILNALYSLGTSSSTFVQRDSIMYELARHRPALGECVASFASTFPVAFLEPQLNKYNKNSILFGIEDDRIAAHSLEAKEVMDEVADNLPPLDKIVAEIEELAESGGKYNEAPHVIEVTLPMLCSYLPFWWSQGPDNVEPPHAGQSATTVTVALMNNVLGNVLKLIGNNIGTQDAPWMNRIATRTQPIIVNATEDMLKQNFLPVAQKLKENSRMMEKEEAEYHSEMRRQARRENASAEGIVQEHYQILVRDMYAFYPLLIKYVDLHRSRWLKNPSLDAEDLYLCVAELFNLWSKSHMLKKEEQNFVVANEIDNMALIMPSQDKNALLASPSDTKSDAIAKKSKKRASKRREAMASLNVACLKRLLPIGLNMFGGHEQELIQQAKQKFIEKDSECDIEDFITASFQIEDKTEDDEALLWQKALYKKIGSKKGDQNQQNDINYAIERVLAMSKVLFGLHLVEHPMSSMEMQWKKAISAQRKRAVMACFRMALLYNLPRHRAINLFLRSYRDQWLDKEEPGHGALIEDITDTAEEEVVDEVKDEDEHQGPQALSQLITCFSRAATTEPIEKLESDHLYYCYANIMSQSCHGDDEEEEDEGGEGEEGNAGASLQEQEMEKLKLLFEQSRLADRGAAEMVIMYISNSRGNRNNMVISTIELGISILRGGNVDVQKRMLAHLRDKKDVGFFTSVAGLMQQCRVLDLDAFERYNKAEGLGVLEGSAQVKNLHDAEHTCKLFRFLQLLCEGHNLEFQNYLRTQAGNTTTVNIVICTVDYLLRLQESMMDFYWHYSGKDTIDGAGKESFFRAIQVASQVFNSITEYIQGPCQGNQLALAHSRLWDAVGGFLYIFAHMQDKLSKDPEQLELLREFMKLQKDMMIMLLSMLEGNVMNGPIGKQMVDTLVESSANFEMILKFFDIFLKMKDMASSEAFMEFDINKDGVISPKEFRRAMETQKIYTEEEIEYIMMCVDANQDGKVDFNEFTDRFHNPAKDIGFNVAVLLTNLSEHIPNDPRLDRFLEKARSVLNYFEQYLGRIEIMGSAGRIERVYFEIKQSHIDQWEKPQIKESKRTFLHNIVNEEGEKGKLECFLNFCEDTIFEESKRSFLHSVVNEEGDKEKLEAFTNFCEDTIFEMQHATSISAEEQAMTMAQYAASKPQGETERKGVVDMVKGGCGAVKDGLMFGLSCLSPSNIREKYHLVKSMTWKERIVGLCKLSYTVVLTLVALLFTVVWTFLKFIYVMMRGTEIRYEKVRPQGVDPMGRMQAISGVPDYCLPEEPQTGGPIEAFGLDITKEQGEAGDVQYKVTPHIDHQQSGSEYSEDGTPVSEGEEQLDGDEANRPHTLPLSATSNGKSKLNGSIPSRSAPADDGAQFDEFESEGAAQQPQMDEIQSKGLDFGKFILSTFARNFYKFKLCALALAFFINFILLFYKVSKAHSELAEGDEGEDEEDVLEFINMPENVNYLEPLLQFLALLHSFIALAIMTAYYCLKVPLVIFKREKEIARSLEFEGLWIAEQPGDDDIKGHWDKLAISTKSFPDKYWDKFVKKKVRNKYSEQYDYDQISNLLGMDKGNSLSILKQSAPSILPAFLSNLDWQYQLWKWGIIFTDNSFIYTAGYLTLSVMGNFNHFFFAAHLLDVAICFKTLGTILQSVTHNGRQLMMTVMLLSIIVYVYTVIAFTFFRKFYAQEEDGQVDYKCHDMLTCYVFHLYVGVRAGGGIGDEIESPDGDPYEVYRILFDITFFFFVIIILLAIIQGLIIDAFGELRDQLEQVKEDLESSCFICGIGKDYFDKAPHGFETHVKNEHNFANYMFFLMHLINKPDTEYTGQESYVWELYQQRCWDFFPVGECFRKLYEDELAAS